MSKNVNQGVCKDIEIFLFKIFAYVLKYLRQKWDFLQMWLDICAISKIESFDFENKHIRKATNFKTFSGQYHSKKTHVKKQK